MFHIVLFEPQIPPNTGNIIRLCANSGATLHLVKPLGFLLDDRSLQRSGLDYHDLADVQVHDSFEQCRRTLASTRLIAVETGAPQRYDRLGFRAGDAFVFGPETRGLPPALLGSIDPAHQVHIPMRTGNRSLNLSNAVALVIYEAWRQHDFLR